MSLLLKIAAFLGIVALYQAQARPYLPKDTGKYAAYNDAYIDQLRDRDFDQRNDFAYDKSDSSEEYSGYYYSDEDDDEDRDYREWLTEKEQYVGRGNDRDEWEYENRSNRRRPSPKQGAFDRPAYEPKSSHKSGDEVQLLKNKLSDMQNEIDDMRGMLKRQRYPYK